MQEFPLLYNTVSSCMLHGPCSDRCVVDGDCSKGFPNSFCNETKIPENSYPEYSRCYILERAITKNGITFTNQHAVPYNPNMFQKFYYHINFEICNSIKAIKYLHKYEYKGYDCASIKVGEIYSHDEITDYVNGCYLGAPDSTWRIHAFKMHGQLHSVVRLAVHDEGMENVYFGDGEELQALENRSNTRTQQLQAWLKLEKAKKKAEKEENEKVEKSKKAKDEKEID